MTTGTGAWQSLAEHFLARRNAFPTILNGEGRYSFEHIRQLSGAPKTVIEMKLVKAEDVASAIYRVSDGGPCTWEPGVEVDHYQFRNPKRRSRPVDLLEFRNVTLSYDIRNMGSPNYYLFDDNSRLIDGMFFGASPGLFPGKALEVEEAIWIDDFFVKFNICHWLFDKLPRYQIARSLNFDAPAAFYWHNKYTAASLEALGVGGIGVADDARFGVVKFGRLVALSSSFGPMTHPAERGVGQFANAFRKLAAIFASRQGGQVSGRDRKIWIDRRPDLPRKIVNFAQIRPILHKAGFEILDVETFDPMEQFALFANAKSIGGIHGAGLANLLFMPPGGTVIEILPPLCATDVYAIGCQAMNHKYLPLVSDDEELGKVDPSSTQHNSQLNRRNVIVDVAQFGEIIRNV